MTIATAWAISKAKKINDVNEWWCEIMNTVWKGSKPYAGDLFQQALASDGFDEDNILKLYKKLREAELPF